MCLDNYATSKDLALNRNKLDKKTASVYYEALNERFLPLVSFIIIWI